MKYKARILQKESYYSGELIKGFAIEIQTSEFHTHIGAVTYLNRKIEQYNDKHNLEIPPLTAKNKFCVEYETDEPFEMPDISSQTVKKKSQPKTKAPEAKPDVQAVKKDEIFAKPTKPKRKPFTPYGLNGYLVDKQGNVRLMLDRRANAHTIVLEPQMFNALAEMVKKTQEQTNATA